LAWSEEGVPFAPDYDDVYYSRSGIEQGDHVFVQGSDLPARLGRGEAITILETGLGLGVNLLAAVRALLAAGRGSLRHVSIELHPLSPAAMAEVHGRLGRWDEVTAAFLEAYPELLEEGTAALRHQGHVIPLELVIGDGVAALRQLDLRADAVFLDGFAPACNPALWSAEVFAELARLARPGASLATYTAAGAVRTGLNRVGFDMRRCEGFGLKRHRLAGRRLADG
jgi:tRNA 5-methylaminomethyl-2-thiouridine biosynthesis bifunctional protein